MTETDSDEPKSALELAMERLKKQDREAGVEERFLSAEQRAAIADARSLYVAKLAECEIFHRDALAKARDPEALAGLEQEYRRDRERIAAERDRKLAELRGEG
jgi:hypothetical protein